MNYGAWGIPARGEFQETLLERFRGLSGNFLEFLPESPSLLQNGHSFGSNIAKKVLWWNFVKLQRTSPRKTFQGLWWHSRGHIRGSSNFPRRQRKQTLKPKESDDDHHHHHHVACCTLHVAAACCCCMLHAAAACCCCMLLLLAAVAAAAAAA